MTKKRGSGKITGRKWLVRAANGDLYVISANNPPVKLVGAAKTNAKKIIDTAEGDLSQKIPETMSSLATGVSLLITEAFGHH
jgi:ABC-type uncharacterized transport system permease subunit